MDLELNEEQKMLKARTRQFVEDKIIPRAKDFDENDETWLEQWKLLCDNDLMGVFFPKEYGGQGLDTISQVIVTVEVARGSITTATLWGANGLGTYPIQDLGNEEQKRKYLPLLAKGEKIGAYGLTEALGGSDVSLNKTTAVLDGNEYVLNGHKTFTTNGGVADIYTIFALTDETKGIREGLSVFVVEKGTKGFSFGKPYDKMGIRGAIVGEEFLDNCRIPRENLLGETGQGFNGVLSSLSRGRVNIGALGVGIAEAAFSVAADYAKQRVQYGQVIARHQGIEWWFADMATEISAARLLTYQAALLKDRNLPYAKEAAMAKVYSSEMANRVCHKALQIHGGHGYMRDLPLERYSRNARILEIYEGTNEIQRILIGRQVLKGI